MPSKEPVYVVLTLSGAVWTGKPPVMTWFSILDTIRREYQSAGGNWDRPHKLLVNGDVVVEKGLADIAWSYGGEFDAARFAAQARVQANYTPDWLKALTKKDGDQ